MRRWRDRAVRQRSISSSAATDTPSRSASAAIVKPWEIRQALTQALIIGSSLGGGAWGWARSAVGENGVEGFGLCFGRL